MKDLLVDGPSFPSRTIFVMKIKSQKCELTAVGIVAIKCCTGLVMGGLWSITLTSRSPPLESPSDSRLDDFQPKSAPGMNSSGLRDAKPKPKNRKSDDHSPFCCCFRPDFNSDSQNSANTDDPTWPTGEGLVQRMETPSYPRNADGFCSAIAHLPVWDTHTMTRRLGVCVCVRDKHALYFGSCDLPRWSQGRKNQSKTDQILRYK